MGYPLKQRRLNPVLLATFVLVLLLAGHASAAFHHGIPNNGDWRFKLDLNPFADGPRWRFCDGNCGNPDLRNGDFNDQASSYSICNRTGGRIGIRVRFWRHINYNDLVHINAITLLHGECHVANFPPAIDNQISSYTVQRFR